MIKSYVQLRAKYRAARNDGVPFESPSEVRPMNHGIRHLSAACRILTLGVVLLFAAACGGGETIVERTVVVEKQVPVQQTVVIPQTVVVEKQVPVVQTVVATVEKIVTPTPPPAKAVKLQVALGALPVNLLGGAMPSQQDRIISTLMYDSFATRDQNGDGPLTPLLGSWTFDGKTVRVKVKNGVQFHNGEKLDAAGTKAVIDYLSSGKTAKFAFTYTRFRDFDLIEVADNSTIDFRLKTPIAFWVIPFRDLFALAPKHLENVGLDGYSDQPVGTGPFQFVQWKRDDSLTLRKFSGYWGQKPVVDEITYRHMPEAAVRIVALEAGQIDIAAFIPPQEVPRLLSKNFRVYTGDSFQTQTVWLDAGRKSVELKDKRVRQAMLYAIDSQGIFNSIVGGYGSFGEGQLSTSAAFGYNPDVKQYPYDPKKAKALLAEAGYPNGFKIKGSATTGRYFRDREVMTALAAQWKQVGIDVEMETPESAAWLQALINNALHPIYNIGMNWGPEDPVSNNRTINERGDPKFTEMANTIRATTDDTLRAKLMRDAIAYANEEAHAWWGYTVPTVYGMKNGLPLITFGKGFEMFIPAASP